MDNKIQESDFIFYRGDDGNIHAQVILGDDTVWVSQKNMAEIFGVTVPTVNYHLSEIFKSEELTENSVIRKIRITANDGKDYLTIFYSLDVIIAVGYRVNSYRATKFRQWSSRILKEYLVKGFVMDDERLKQGNKLFGKDYFKELLERIRDIRASERMFYEKIRDLYAESVDYDKHDPATHKFFAKVQNKVEYAVVGRTSAETIRLQADATMPNMGLRTWKNINKDGKIQKSDIVVAKNYFNQDQIRDLNNLVNMFLDFAELQVQRKKVMKMVDWEKRLDDFLNFNEFAVLPNAGNISKEQADKHAALEYEKYKKLSVQEDSFSEISDTIKKGGALPSETEMFKVEDGQLSDFDKKIKAALTTKPMPLKKPKDKN
ncbi:virulence RhuM family protein [Mucilaginibacter myungsuensis]|uniref:Virulence RhuM family protein n=1 Tax=Mucilaginibacter myungsuensis TaxID=649104 RepID=A0A929KWG1_9SPHI|nr:virulence RhuM family protein [Mucilaginibacter myungsuensis]MBE9661708.1 virulence RhuM family protein [Mucilaginibacter myungsuensis]MDN3597851.1 virulence RhuM family protein [Mucilaginibacter myungsuensis]